MDERRRGTAALLAALAVLLWLVAVASRNERPDASGPARGALVASPRLLASFYGVVGVLGLAQAALLAGQAWRRRGLGEPKRRRPWRGLVWVGALLLVCAVLAGLSFPDWARLGRGGGGPPGSHPPRAPAAAGRPPAARSPRVLGLEALAFAGALTALAVLLAARRRRAAPVAAAEELKSAIERSLEELRGVEDPREAVIAAYSGMEEALAAHGIPRAPAEAPLEYLARALAGLRVSAGSARRLTELFEWARFSRHEVDEPMKAAAIGALAAVRDDLEGVAA